MPSMDSSQQRVPPGLIRLEELPRLRRWCQAGGKRVVSTNGGFEILHAGHVRFLERAKSLGDVLVVGLNSDSSVRGLKGPDRPWVTERQRAQVLVALRAVDYVVVFHELLPKRFLQLLRPAVHCKAADYSIDGLPEREVVEAGGGEVRILPLEQGTSTSSLVGRIVASSVGAVPPGGTERAQALDEMSGLERMLGVANVIRRSGYRFSRVIEDAARVIACAADTGRLYFCGSSGDGAFERYIASEYELRLEARADGFGAAGAASGLDVGGPGDVLVVLLADEGMDVMAERCTAARSRGLAVVALGEADAARRLTGADVRIELPAADFPLARLLQHSLLYAILDQVWQLRQATSAARGVVGT